MHHHREVWIGTENPVGCFYPDSRCANCLSSGSVCYNRSSMCTFSCQILYFQVSEPFICLFRDRSSFLASMQFCLHFEMNHDYLFC